MNDSQENLKPGTHVEVLTKRQPDGQNYCGTVIGAAPNTSDTYIVEYYPGMDNGHHSGNELKVIETLPIDSSQEQSRNSTSDQNIGITEITRRAFSNIEPVLCPGCEQQLYVVQMSDNPRLAEMGGCTCKRKAYDIPNPVVFGIGGTTLLLFKEKST